MLACVPKTVCMSFFFHKTSSKLNVLFVMQIFTSFLLIFLSDNWT